MVSLAFLLRSGQGQFEQFLTKNGGMFYGRNVWISLAHRFN